MLQEAKLASLLDRALNQTAKIRKGNEMVYHCVFCNHYKKKLEVNIETQNWHCWVCHARGNSIRSLFRKLRVNTFFYSELYKITKGVDYKKFKNDEAEESLNLPNEFLSLSSPSKSLEFGNAISYLRNRSIMRDDILRYNIGYCENGEYRQRIIIPSYDKNGNINFFTARSYYPSNHFKYMLPPWSKDIIGNELFINWNEPITLVEGSMDAIAVKKNAIPLFGTTMSKSLKGAFIENGVERVNIVLDNDALKKAIQIHDFIESLKADEINVHLIKLEDKDPSVLGFSQINEIINSSKPIEFSDLIELKINN